MTHWFPLQNADGLLTGPFLNKHFLFLDKNQYNSVRSDVQLWSIDFSWAKRHWPAECEPAVKEDHVQGEDDHEDISASDNSLPTKKQMFPARESLPVAAWEATACASGVGLVSCVCPGSGERCSTHRKSTHPCSPRPSEALRRKRKKNHKVKIMTLSAIWLMNHSRRKVLFKEQLKAKYLILWLAPAWCALNSRGRVRWKKVSQVVTSHSVTSFESLTCFCGSKHHNSTFLSLFLTDRKPRNSYLRQTFEGLGRAYFANIVC